MNCLKSIWDCFTQFCSCLQEDHGVQSHDQERTHLLDPVYNIQAMQQSHSEVNNEYSQSLPKKDDHNELSRLVQNTALNMIDVGAMDSHNLEHQEYNERIRRYSQRLQQQWSKVQFPGKAATGILKDVHNIEYHLTKHVLAEDIMLIGTCMNKLQLALADIRITNKEAIVVPFRIP